MWPEPCRCRSGKHGPTAKVALGIVAAVRRNFVVDTLASGAALGGQAAPVDWFGLLLILVLNGCLGWFPSMVGGTARAMVLPTITLAVSSMERITRLMRSAVLDALRLDDVRVVRSNGIRERVVLYEHLLRSAAIPIVTMIGFKSADCARCCAGARGRGAPRVGVLLARHGTLAVNAVDQMLSTTGTSQSCSRRALRGRAVPLHQPADRPH